MPVASGDYRDIRSVAVHTEDVATAVESTLTGGSRTVLRVTPPFSGRMRARLHVERPEEYAETNPPRPIHIDPTELLTDPPDPPTPDESENRLRADPDTEYTVETHHDRHRAAMAAWRETLAERIAETVALDGEHGPHRVSVLRLG